MTQCKSLVFAVSAFSLALALTQEPSDAQAQPESLTIDTSTGTAPAPPEPASGAPAQGAPAPNAAGEGGDNAFYGEYLEDVYIEDSKNRHFGVTPATHTVRRGDTLWDLSAYYLHNAWNWPKIWKLNPEIADPHRIYPGNIVRLRTGGNVKQVAAAKPGARRQPVRALQGYGLRQTAYVDLKDLEDAGTVDGAVEEKTLLAQGDFIYVNYGDEPPKVGATYAVYGKGKKIRRDGKKVGEYVEVAGELRIASVAKDKRARAVITRSVNPIERGMRVGPLKLNFDQVEVIPADTKVVGDIVDLIGPDELIGSEAAVIINRGSRDGVQVGNRFLVFRSGDAYDPIMHPGDSVGRSDKKYPNRAFGEVIILQTGEQASMGVVSFAMHEFGVGDHVVMRKGQ